MLDHPDMLGAMWSNIAGSQDALRPDFSEIYRASFWDSRDITYVCDGFRHRKATDSKLYTYDYEFAIHPEFREAIAPLYPLGFPVGVPDWEHLGGDSTPLDDTPHFSTLLRRRADDVFSFPLFSEEFCDLLLEELLEVNEWRFSAGDNYPAPEIGLMDIGLDLGMLVSCYLNQTWRLVSAYLWDFFYCQDYRDIFVIKYDKDLQDSLAKKEHSSLEFHHDVRPVSLTCSLNDGYSGGGMEWKRQERILSSEDLPKGHAVTFPGRVTHMHRGVPVTEGTRYSFVAWSGN